MAKAMKLIVKSMKICGLDVTSDQGTTAGRSGFAMAVSILIHAVFIVRGEA
jgi:hypothetical protein